MSIYAENNIKILNINEMVTKDDNKELALFLPVQRNISKDEEHQDWVAQQDICDGFHMTQWLSTSSKEYLKVLINKITDYFKKLELCRCLQLFCMSLKDSLLYVLRYYLYLNIFYFYFLMSCDYFDLCIILLEFTPPQILRHLF